MSSLETKEALYAHLVGDTELVSLLHDVESVYERNGPQEAVFPFVVYFKKTGVPEYSFGEGPNFYDDETWVIKGIDRDDSARKAQVIADRIEVLVNDAPLAINGHDLLFLRKYQDLDYTETEPGNTIHHIGAEYRLCKEAV